MNDDSMIYVSLFTYPYLVMFTFGAVSSIYSMMKKDGKVASFVPLTVLSLIGFLCNLNTYHPQW